jgi:hypothetical protein
VCSAAKVTRQHPLIHITSCRDLGKRQGDQSRFSTKVHNASREQSLFVQIMILILCTNVHKGSPAVHLSPCPIQLVMQNGREFFKRTCIQVPCRPSNSLARKRVNSKGLNMNMKLNGSPSSPLSSQVLSLISFLLSRGDRVTIRWERRLWLC